MAFSNFTTEHDIPTVIVNMPELQRMAARRKALNVVLFGAAALMFLALCGLIYLELTARPKETIQVESAELKKDDVRLTVKLVPPGISGTVVEVDGEIITGNPPYVYLPATENYHSIRVNAPGFESLSKDVQLTTSEVMTFTLIPKNAPVVADNTNDPGVAGTDDELDEFGTNSDDLVEEIVSNEADNDELDPATARNNTSGARPRNPNAKAQRPPAEKASRLRPDVTASTPRQSVPAAASPSEQRGSSPVAAVADRNNSPAARPPVDPVASPAMNTAVGGATRASLIINAPLGMSSRVAVSIDGQMRGYLPVLLKVDAGLHELTFVYEGHRTFQMVKLNPGQIVRIIPNL